MSVDMSQKFQAKMRQKRGRHTANLLTTAALEVRLPAFRRICQTSEALSVTNGIEFVCCKKEAKAALLTLSRPHLKI
jgi:hypothetical protein